MINNIMNVTDGSQVLLVQGEKDKIQMSKIIPLPTFLVSHFINGGEPRNVVAAFQAFTKEFYDMAPPLLKLCIEYIFHFVSSNQF